MNISTNARHARSRSTPPRASLTQWTALIALAALLGGSWRRWRDTHQRRMAARPRAEPEKLQVWEDEGGQSQMPDEPAR
jgi:hypothetical protein